ncbi:MAG: molybdopterin molybdotransferase MoeA [Chloroflexi bacterium]|nr:molybdopterin molybdotransferase MoeA [Chloroflexota bacterium]
MVPVAEAIQTIIDLAAPLGIETVDALSAAGRTLAETVRSGESVPAGPRAAVDGYALRAGDQGERGLVSGEIAAGREQAIAVGPGQAVRIMTGGALPAGADAVVMVEDTEERDAVVTVRASLSPGAHIHATGQDIASGQVLLEPGATIGAAEIGVLATVGKTRVQVYRRPRVAVLATGDELVEPWETPPAGCIRDSNRYALLEAVRAAGAEPVWSGVARDTEDELATRFDEARHAADVVITSGGVSMGTRDLIKPLLQERGTIHFGRVNFKPGKPLTVATVDRTLVFGLPGYPVSSLVTFEVFVRPALLALQGAPQLFRPRVDVELEHELRPDAVRPEYARAIVRWQHDRLVARTTGAQGSSRLLSMLGANALLVLAPSEQPLPAGTQVSAMLTGPLL